MVKLGTFVFVTFLAGCTIFGLTTIFSFGPHSVPNIELDTWWGPSELKGKEDRSVKPFKIQWSEEMIKDLQYRLNNHKPFTKPLEGVGFEYGFNQNYLQTVIDYWRKQYNFKERETFLNKYDHFKTNIQGLDIHFIHVKPKATADAKVVPMLLLHGWPGSVREFYEIIPKLTTEQPGYNFVFELIIPSLPGYGFSSAAVRPKLGATEVSIVMRNLMHRLGFTKFYVQGGDWGSIIAASAATLFPHEILGHHNNLPYIQTLKSTFWTAVGAYIPSLVVKDEFYDRMYPLSKYFNYLMEETGYMHLQSTKPDTIGVALSDSPSGLAAYILEKFSTWTNPDYRHSPDGKLTAKFTLDQLLDNVMIYWSTNCITTSMRLYAESFSIRHRSMGIGDKIPTITPTWVLQAKYELAFQPASMLREKYLNLLGDTVLDDGGHFLALEMPDVVAKDIFKAVNVFRNFHAKNSSLHNEL